MNNAQERRKYPRKTTVKILEVFDLNTEEYLGNVVDISQGGIMLITRSNIQEGTVYQVVIKIPDDYQELDSITFGGEILWTEDSLDPNKKWVGMQIIDISPDTQNKIRQLIDHYL